MTKINGYKRLAQHYNIPALMICLDRLEYTQRAFNTLLNSDCTTILLVDNGSTAEGKAWVMSQASERVMVSIRQAEGTGSIAHAMNHFLAVFPRVDYAIKVDNDTLIPPDFCARMLTHMQHADIVQAKHHIIEATNPRGWEGFVAPMRKEHGLCYNHFVGGSGIMFKRQLITSIPETDWAIGGWRAWQRRYPDVKKAFAEDVEIKLLDDHGYGDYPDYYKQTGRL